MKKLKTFGLSLLFFLPIACHTADPKSDEATANQSETNKPTAEQTSADQKSGSADVITPGYTANKVNLPFNYEEYKDICNSDTSKCKLLFPFSTGENMPDIKKLVLDYQGLTNPEIIFRINNGDQTFDTYLFESVSDAETQTLINVRDNKIIASLYVADDKGGQEKSVQTFVLNKDLTIDIYDKNQETGAKKMISRHKINPDGKISRL